MVKIVIGGVDFELYEYNTPIDTPLNIVLNPGTFTLEEIAELITEVKGDLVVKNDDEEIARFVNYTELRSISQDYISKRVTLSIAHPSDAERLDNLERNIGEVGARVGNIDTKVNNVDSSVMNLSNTVVDQGSQIRITTNHLTKAEENINNIDTSVGQLDVQVQRANENININTNDITSHSTLLDVIQDAIDDIIMGERTEPNA